MVTAERLSRLLLLLYESASSPGRMPAFLAELTQTVGATGAIFREHTFSASRSFHVDTIDLSETIGYSDEALSIYVKHYWEKDIYLQRALERFRTADCGASQVLTTKAELHGSVFHADYLVPFDVGPMIWAKIAERPDYHASISIVRPNKAPFFEEAELELLTALAPHLHQTLWLTRTLHNLQSSNAMLSQGIDGMGIAICMARQDGSILRSTEGAECLFAGQDGVSLQNGKIKVMVAREQQALDALITGTCNTGANRDVHPTIHVQAKAAGNATVSSWTAQAGGALLITRKLSSRPLQVVVSPFHPGALLNEPQATALIQFSDPYATPKSRAAVLRALYALTPTESRLANYLLQGLEVREMANQMKITVETARLHLKHVLAKTDTRRQAELMRLMLSLPGQ